MKITPIAFSPAGLRQAFGNRATYDKGFDMGYEKGKKDATRGLSKNPAPPHPDEIPVLSWPLHYRRDYKEGYQEGYIKGYEKFQKQKEPESDRRTRLLKKLETKQSMLDVRYKPTYYTQKERLKANSNYKKQMDAALTRQRERAHMGIAIKNKPENE